MTLWLYSTEIKEGAKVSISPLRMSGILPDTVWPLSNLSCTLEKYRRKRFLLRPVTAFISKILKEFKRFNNFHSMGIIPVHTQFTFEKRDTITVQPRDTGWINQCQGT